MAFDPVLKKLFNDFANSQPALQIPGKPAGVANPKLGDLLEDALAESAAEATFSPATPANWTPAPTGVAAALDQLASRMTVAEADVIAAQDDATQALADAATAQATAENAESQTYTANDAGDWATSAPVDIKSAIDRMSALLYVLNSNTAIP